MIKKEWLQEPVGISEIRMYRLERQISLYTTRFNNETYLQNQRAKKRLKKASLYCNPTSLPQDVKQESPVFVLELNNSENKIMGIGLIYNIYNDNKVYRIYDNDFYNQPFYEGKYHISRSQMTSKELEFLDALEKICFYGKSNLKRGHKMTSFPWKIILNCAKHGVHILKQMEEMFHSRSYRI
jgi:hypothetical protein